MKNTLYLVLILLSFINCRDNDDKEINPNILPEATQTGANTGGALINEKVWVSSTVRTTNMQSPAYTEMETYYDQGGKFRFNLGLKQINGEEYIKIRISSSEALKLNFPYVISNEEWNSAFYAKGTFGSVYFTNQNYKGTMTITKFSKDKPFISGTFEFQAIDNDGNIINVTSGRFDKLYIGG